MGFVLELVLTLAPFAVLLTLLLRGCFPGERAIIAHRLRSVARRLRPAKVRWGRTRSASQSPALVRTALSLRGPPAVA